MVSGIRGVFPRFDFWMVLAVSPQGSLAVQADRAHSDFGDWQSMANACPVQRDSAVIGLGHARNQARAISNLRVIGELAHVM